MMDATAAARFERAILPHLDSATTLARYLMGNTADAEDVVQDACMRAIRYFASFEGDDGRAWLLAITRRVAFDALRTRRDASLVSLDDEAAEAVAPEAAATHDGDATLDWVALEGAMAQLPPAWREVIVLRELDDLSYAQIAAVTGAPIGTVMSRLARARQRLRALLATPSTGSRA